MPYSFFYKSDANLEIRCGLCDSGAHPYYIARFGLAILRIEGVDLPFVELANSELAKVGEEVMPIGTAEGLDQTASNGIVSGRREQAVCRIFRAIPYKPTGQQG